MVRYYPDKTCSMQDEFFGEIAKRTAQKGEGATFDPRTGQEPSSGWAVAQAGHEHVEPSQTFSEDSLRRYAGAHRDAISQAGYMGLWHPSRVQSGRPRGVYHDVTAVKPNTYGGGARAIASGYLNNQDAIYNIDRMQELHMRPATRSQRRGTRQAMGELRAQRPEPEGQISEMPTSSLGAALRNRRRVN